MVQLDFAFILKAPFTLSPTHMLNTEPFSQVLFLHQLSSCLAELVSALLIVFAALWSRPIHMLSCEMHIGVACQSHVARNMTSDWEIIKREGSHIGHHAPAGWVSPRYSTLYLDIAPNLVIHRKPYLKLPLTWECYINTSVARISFITLCYWPASLDCVHDAVPGMCHDLWHCFSWRPTYRV